MADDFKYHIDHHASLRASTDLSDARARHASGEIDDDALCSAEDAAITEALRMQRRLGLAALSDGEFRRRNHLSVVYDGVDGFGDASSDPSFARLVGPLHAPEVRVLTGPPRERGRLVKHETDFLLSAIQRPSMIALPSPGFLAELSAGDNDVAAVGAEFARILRDEIAAIAADGVRYVLLRNPAYAFLLSSDSVDADRVGTIDRMLAADALVLQGLETDDEFRVGLDISTAAAVTSGYDVAAVRRFGAQQPFGRLCVEYRKPPEHRFPIAELPAGTVVSLGVVDVSAGELEDVDELVGRIDEAATLMDLDDIAISTNGGFHAADRPVSADEEHSKLQLVEMVARYFWGNEL